MTVLSSVFEIGGKLDSKLCGGSKLGSQIVGHTSFCDCGHPAIHFSDCGHPAIHSETAVTLLLISATAVTVPSIWPFLPTLPLVSATAVIVPPIWPFWLAFCRLLLRFMAGRGCAKPDTCLEAVREPPLKIHWLHFGIAMLRHKC